jgi:hypothetical protein
LRAALISMLHFILLVIGHFRYIILIILKYNLNYEHFFNVIILVWQNVHCSAIKKKIKTILMKHCCFKIWRQSSLLFWEPVQRSSVLEKMYSTEKDFQNTTETTG